MMRRDPAEPLWRVWRRRVFGGFLAAALLIGLFVSFRPTTFGEDDDDEVAVEEEGPTEQPQNNRGNNRNDDGGEPEDDGVAEEESEGLTQEEADELIGAAREPEETSVQVLDAGGGSSATSAVQAALDELGYDVVAVNASRTKYPVTTVLYTDGNDAEAEALRARDDRFTEIAPNEKLSDGVDIHVVVGPDWAE